MQSGVLAGVALAAILLPSFAAAGPQPAVYWMGDREASPLEDGALSAIKPVATQSSTRTVGVAATEAAPVRFLTNTSVHPERMLGPVYLALWTGPSLALKGNLTATMFIENGAKDDLIANASLVLDANASKVPQPTALMPPTPDPASDPQQIIAQTAYYELAQLLPVVTPPAELLFLGNVNVTVNSTARVGVRFEITAGSSTLPTAQSLAASLLYNSTTAPSFLYVPWYVPSPKRTVQPTPEAEPTPTSQEVAIPAEADDGGRGVPSPAAAIALASLAAVILVVRRRAH